MPSFHVSRGAVITLLSLASLLVGLGIVFTSQASSPQVKPGTKRMAARLEQHAQSASLLPNHPMNTEAVKMLRQQLAKARDFKLQFDLRFKIASTLLLSGKSLEAVQEFQEVQQWVEENNIQLSAEVRWALRDSLALAYLRLGEQENCIAGQVENKVQYR